MARTGKPAARHVAAVERAVALLDTLADGEPELGTNELARRTGLHPSSVSRLLATLVAAGLVEHVETSGRYRLGIRLLDLGNAVLARLDLREVARGHLAALVDETGETATLSAPGDPDAVTVDFVQSASSVQSVARLGRPSVAHATATGKVALAFGGIALPPGRLRQFTARTIVDRSRLDTEVERVRADGWSRAQGEREEELNALAAPVRGSRGELAAILGLQGPASRFGEEAMARAVAPLLARAAAVSHALGWRAPDEEDT
ncbi:MAG: IclR family transcriptional regulator [Gaiellaceae bacterium]